jgi:hypothetical protein
MRLRGAVRPSTRHCFGSNEPTCSRAAWWASLGVSISVSSAQDVGHESDMGSACDIGAVGVAFTTQMLTRPWPGQGGERP